jgi:8-oxo-dGTP pyrophosphatase MutT (NUDIX family)
MPLSRYLRAVRAKIGHDLLMLQSATVMLFDGADRLLLARDTDSGLWMTIGGAIEPDEAPADAAVREVWEETGLLVEPSGILGVFGGPEFRITYPNGDNVSYIVTVFAARLVGGEPRADGTEASELRFISRDEIATLPMAPWTREIVTRVFDRNEIPYFAPSRWRPTIST